MKAKASRSPFSDPFDELSDQAFEREVLEALDKGTTKISLRVPNAFLAASALPEARAGTAP